VGCYTSQVRIKQKHRLLENELYMLEKTASAAELAGLAVYPDLDSAFYDLLMGEFHDILPGSSIQPVEDAGLRLFDHGLEIASRERARMFFRLASGQPKAKEDTIPVLAWNPHPYPVRGVFEVEFNLPDAHWEEQYTMPVVRRDGAPIPCQCEQQQGNINLDWRKRVVFEAELAPCSMNRFDCTLERVLPAKPAPTVQPENGLLHFNNGALEVVINTATGLVDKLAVDGHDYVRPGAFLPLVMTDDADPWGMRYNKWRDIAGKFTPLTPEKAGEVAGLGATPLDAVYVTEDGEVRTVVEALLGHGDSFLVLTYMLPKHGTEIEVHVRVHWNEKDRLLKLAVPTALTDAKYMGQVAFGRDELPGVAHEAVAQKWVAAVSETDGLALAAINDGVYGSDFVDGEMRLTLMRSPSYSGHPIGDRPVTPPDRYTIRQEQGERQFRFWFRAGAINAVLGDIDRVALSHNERPFVLSFYPTGAGQKPPFPLVQLDGDAVLMTAFKRASDGNGYVIRLFEPTGAARVARLRIPLLGLDREVALSPFEIKTFVLDAVACTFTECDLMEHPL
jgi:alpha-mannosidase